MRRTSKFTGLFALSALAAAPALLPANAPRLEPPRVANTDLVINELPVNTPVEKELTALFPGAEWNNATAFSSFTDGSGRVAIADRTAGIYQVPATIGSAEELILDLSGQVCTTTGEQGVLGVAVAPDYAVSGAIYVFYTPNTSCGGDGPSRVSRFVAPEPTSGFVDPLSEVVLLEWTSPTGTNLGGDLAFGPDGMLYIAIGDGGDADGGTRAQDTTTLHGTLLRIDVTGTPDAGLAYRIPPDNPFFEEGPNPATRKEIFAYGLRSPRNITFDPTSNINVWLADAGELLYDEINVILGGENLGRGRMEGRECFPGGGFNCAQMGLTLPIMQIPLSGGPSVIGDGVIYTGIRHPELFGSYVYTIPAAGELRTVRNNGFGGVSSSFLLASASSGGTLGPVGMNAEEELLLIENTDAGRLREVTRKAGTAAPDTFPRKLTQLPALWLAGKGRGHEVPGVLFYRPSAQLWTDNTHKDRYIAVPGLEKVGWREFDGWDYPDNTVIVKNFIMPLDDRDEEGSLKRLETRILYFKNSQWFGYSYQWNEDETDAYLLSTRVTRNITVTQMDGSPLTFPYLWPSSTDCRSCHNATSSFTLGISTSALNFEITYPGTGVTANQLETLNTLSLFNEPLPRPVAELSRMPDYHDTSLLPRDRAKAYLHANCQHCHRPGGVLPGAEQMDLRWQTVVNDMKIINAEPGRASGLFPAGSKLLVPGDEHLSLIYLRPNALEPAKRMPPVATSRIDEEGVAIIRDWIQQLGINDRNTWIMH